MRARKPVIELCTKLLQTVILRFLTVEFDGSLLVLPEPVKIPAVVEAYAKRCVF